MRRSAEPIYAGAIPALTSVMCLAVPYKIKKIKDGYAWIENDRKVSLALIPNASIDDWLLVHADLAVNILTENEAGEILNLVKNCPHD